MATGEQTSNVGEVGIKSIRIAGMRIEDLPMVPGAHAKMQLPLAIDNERKQRIKDVVKKYPHQKVPALEAAINECNENIRRQTNYKAELAKKIAEYEGLKSYGDYGKQQLEALDPGGKIAAFFGQIGAEQHRAREEGREPDIPDVSEEEYAVYEQIKAIRVNYPPYDREALEKQIEQFREGIAKADEVIATEYKSIAEFTGVLTLCRIRDEELAGLGVVASQ